MATAKPPKPPSRPEIDTKWDAVIRLVLDEKLYLVELPSPDNTPRFDSPRLSTADRALLSAERYASRTAARLKDRYMHQGLEIGRLVRWLGTIEKEETKYPTVGQQLSIVEAPSHIQTLATRYRGDPAISKARYELMVKRYERAKANAQAAAKSKKAARDQAQKPTLDQLLAEGLEKRRREAREHYPKATVTENAEVRALLNALRDCAIESKITEAADRVSRSSEASEDVMRYGPNLAMAYQKYARDALARQAAYERTRRKDFGRER